MNGLKIVGVLVTGGFAIAFIVNFSSYKKALAMHD